MTRGQETQVARRAGLVSHLRAWGQGRQTPGGSSICPAPKLWGNRLPSLSGSDGTTVDPRLCPSL